MTKRYFDALIGESPVSTVDIDAVIARERRGGRQRRAAVGVMAAVTVVVVLVGVRMVIAAPTWRGAALPAAPSTTPAPVSPPSTIEPSGPTGTGSPPTGPRSIPRDRKTVQMVADRLTDAMRQAVRRAAPNAELYSIGSSLPFQMFADLLMPTDVRPDPYYTGDAIVRNGGRAGRVIITVSDSDPLAQIPEPGSQCIPLPDHPCPVKSGRGSHGERYAGFRRTVPMGTFLPDAPNFEMSESWALVRHADGTVVYVMANNMVFTGDNRLAPGSHDPALTVDQVVAIALDPALTPY